MSLLDPAPLFLASQRFSPDFRLMECNQPTPAFATLPPGGRAPHVFAVVVSYRPDPALLARLLDALRPQTAGVLVVDNGSDMDIVSWLAENGYHEAVCARLNRNQGVAAAQNVGIRIAREAGATHVILFDQDSEPAPDMVERLLSAAYQTAAAGHQVAALGPRYLDARQDNPPPFIQVRRFRVRRMPCESLTDIVPVDYLVSSGLLIPMAVLDRVGGMREELFIDYVDIEWGLRAGAAGYRSFGVCGAFMNHQLGETPISFMGKPRPVHTPLRHYYAVRNGIWMYFQPFPPFNWKVRDAYRLALKFMFYCLMTKRRGSHFRMMALGIWHGLLGRMGSIDDATGKVSGSP